MGDVLFILLSLDLAGFAHGDISGNATALIALVLAIIALIPVVRTRV